MIRFTMLVSLILGLSAPAFGQRPRTYVEPPYDKPLVVQVDRLEKLAAYIEKLPPKRLDMTSFTGTGDSDDPSSSGCALFHGTATMAFRGDGLIPFSYIGSSYAPSYRSLAPMQSAEAFFGITSGDAMRLFGGDPRTPAEEARLLREVAARERLRLARIERRGLCELVGW